MPKPDLKRLQRAIGYQFENLALLEQALTHRSMGKTNNERLEFLGDSILNHAMADALFHQFSDQKEGVLSRLRANLVKGDTLAEIAREFNLGDYLSLGPGELKSGGFRRDSILADAVEAIIGAINLDANLVTAIEVTTTWYKERLSKIETDNAQVKDAKTRLQEYLQKFKQALPKYSVINITGTDHDQLFEVSCVVEQLPKPIIASGNSRRIAEQRAAKSTLVALGVDKK